MKKGLYILTVSATAIALIIVFILNVDIDLKAIPITITTKKTISLTQEEIMKIYEVGHIEGNLAYPKENDTAYTILYKKDSIEFYNLIEKHF